MAAKKIDKRLTLRLEPSEKFVTVDVFVAAMTHFRRAVKGLTSSAGRKIDWVVVGLEIGSAEAALEPIGDAAIGLRAVELGGAAIRALEERKPLPAGVPDEFVDGMRDLAELGIRYRVRTKAGRGARLIALTRNVVEAVEELHEPETAEEFGSIEGALEGIDIHGKFECAIYTDLGGHRVAIEFEETKLGTVMQAFGRRVLARGTITSNKLGRPIRIHAETIEVLPSDEELPSIDDLVGIAPEITGRLSTNEYIRSLREGDDE